LKKIESRISFIVTEIVKADALELFDRALQIKVACDEDGNMTGALSSFVQKRIAESESKKFTKNLQTAVELAAFTGPAVYTIGSAILLGSPIGWGALIISAASFGVTQLYKSYQLSDYYDFYAKIFDEVDRDFDRVEYAINKEIEYFELKRMRIDTYCSIKNENLNLLTQQYLWLKKQDYLQNEDEKELFDILEDLIRG